jgi:hypothetical protein
MFNIRSTIMFLHRITSCTLPMLILVSSIIGCGGGSSGTGAGGGGGGAVIAAKLHGIDFSPFINGQDPSQDPVANENQVRARMQIVAPYTNWIRTFGGDGSLARAGAIAHSLGLKIARGAWLGRNTAANEREVASLIAAAMAGEADMLVGGNGVLRRGDLQENELLAFINRVKQQASGIPVSYVDVHGIIKTHPALIRAVDIVTYNSYPYWEGVRSDNMTLGGPVVPAIGFTSVPPRGSQAILQGQVYYVDPGAYNVAVYIYVDGWWTKPYWNQNSTPINSNGTWICDITTGGLDTSASQVAAFLIPRSYHPPNLSGQPNFPQSLESKAVAKVHITR